MVGPAPTLDNSETVWIEDAPPAGSTLGQVWQWDTTYKASGTQSHKEPPAAGEHEHWFYNATSTIYGNDGDQLTTLNGREHR